MHIEHLRKILLFVLQQEAYLTLFGFRSLILAYAPDELLAWGNRGTRLGLREIILKIF
jgi:hypothetical protein